MPTDAYVLTLSCPNRPGIVAAVAGYLYQQGCNIFEAQQFDDSDTNRFFMRVLFNPQEDGVSFDVLQSGFQAIARRNAMEWTMRDRKERRQVMILVSKFDHCLADLLYRWRRGELKMDIAAIVSNHPRETFSHLDFDGIPFHYLPVDKNDKASQEAQILELIDKTATDLVVLARYMQILSDEMSAKLANRCINIHHSFLPSFKGARPYHQAFEHGVKLIGATAHYVTADLDEGPIIEQDVERVSHMDMPDDLIQRGRDIERRVLARALSWHLQDRIILNGGKTVVFS